LVRTSPQTTVLREFALRRCPATDRRRREENFGTIDRADCGADAAVDIEDEVVDIDRHPWLPHLIEVDSIDRGDHVDAVWRISKWTTKSSRLKPASVRSR
jgi:hypothetical protein